MNKYHQPPKVRVLAAVMVRLGVHVSYALTTGLALALLSRNRYLAVISDVGRREGPREGFHLLDVMRARGDATPVIFFSSLDAPELRDEASLHDAQGSTNDADELVRTVTALRSDASLRFLA